MPKRYTQNPEEYLGDFKTRIDREVDVSTSDPPSKPIGWTVKWVDGAEVLLPDGTLAVDLQEGMEALAPSLVGYVPVIVHFDEYGEAYGESEKSIFPFYRAKDDRNCWVCSTGINKKVLAKVQL